MQLFNTNIYCKTNINQTNFLLSLFFYEESIIVLIKNLTIMKKLSFAELKGRVSWGSVLGGVMTVLAISVLLSILNTSIGLFMLNPLSEHPASGIGTAVGIGSAVILVAGMTARWLCSWKACWYGWDNTRISSLGYHVDCCCNTRYFFGGRHSENDSECTGSRFIRHR